MKWKQDFAIQEISRERTAAQSSLAGWMHSLCQKGDR